MDKRKAAFRRAIEEMAQYKFGEEVLAGCIAAIEEFDCPGGWAKDNPTHAATARKVAKAAREAAGFVARGAISPKDEQAYAERQVIGKWRERGRTAYSDDFVRMETTLMATLINAGAKQEDAAKWAFKLIEAAGLVPESSGSEARLRAYSAAAILERWKKRR